MSSGPSGPMFVFVIFIKQTTEKILENGKKYWKNQGNLSLQLITTVLGGRGGMTHYNP